MQCDPKWLTTKEQAMQHTLNEFMVEVLQGRYDVEVLQSRYDTLHKPATYEDLC